MALVVRVIVGAVLAEGAGVLLEGDVDCVCADTKAAAARNTKAKDRFFTLGLDLGEMRDF